MLPGMSPSFVDALVWFVFLMLNPGSRRMKGRKRFHHHRTKMIRKCKWWTLKISRLKTLFLEMHDCKSKKTRSISRLLKKHLCAAHWIESTFLRPHIRSLDHKCFLRTRSRFRPLVALFHQSIAMHRLKQMTCLLWKWTSLLLLACVKDVANKIVYWILLLFFVSFFFNFLFFLKSFFQSKKNNPAYKKGFNSLQ